MACFFCKRADSLITSLRIHIDKLYKDYDSDDCDCEHCRPLFTLKEVLLQALQCLDHATVAYGDYDKCIDYIDSIKNADDDLDPQVHDLLEQVKQTVLDRTIVYTKSASKR